MFEIKYLIQKQASFFCTTTINVLTTLAIIFLPHTVQAIEVTDQRGKALSLPRAVERAVFLPMPAPSTFIAIDQDDRRIAGMNRASAAAMRDGILGRFFPGFSRIATDVTQGNTMLPNVEQILTLNPDLVVQWATEGDAPIAMLERAGLRVMGIRYGGQAEMAAYTALLGAAAGQEARAAEIMSRQAAARTQLDQAMAGLAVQARPGVLYLNRYNGGLSVGGADSYIDFCIRLGGGRNVAADLPRGGRAVTVEQVLVWNPDVILLGNFDTAMPADLYADPRLQAVAAVRDARVYRMPLGGYRWDPPSQESALAWAWIAGLLQPGRLDTGLRPDLRADIRDWYRFLYAQAVDDADIDAILFTAANSRSAGYQRFVAGRP